MGELASYRPAVGKGWQLSKQYWYYLENYSIWEALLDRIDQKILEHLQIDARTPLAQLSDLVGLTPSPCHRRIRRLEAKGVINGYTARIDQEEYGLSVNAFVSVRLRQSTELAMQKFERQIQELDDVVECFLVSGRQDYLLRVVSRTLKTYEHFIRHDLTSVDEIYSVESIFAFGQVKRQSKLPQLV